MRWYVGPVLHTYWGVFGFLSPFSFVVVWNFLCTSMYIWQGQDVLLFYCKRFWWKLKGTKRKDRKGNIDIVRNIECILRNILIREIEFCLPKQSSLKELFYLFYLYCFYTFYTSSSDRHFELNMELHFVVLANLSIFNGEEIPDFFLREVV